MFISSFPCWFQIWLIIKAKLKLPVTGIHHTYFQVLKTSQYLLLQTASPDALFRLEYTPLADQREELSRIYFQEQRHNSLEDFLAHHIRRNNTQEGGLLMQVGAYTERGERGEQWVLTTN